MIGGGAYPRKNPQIWVWWAKSDIICFKLL